MMTDVRWTATRGFVAPLLIIAMAAPLLAGCGVVRQMKGVAQNLAKSNIESTLPEIEAAVEASKPATWFETKANAAADLTEQGLDFACLFPVDDVSEAAQEAIDNELLRREQEAASWGLQDIAAEYAYARAPEEDLETAQAVATGLFVIGTYCNIEGAGF